MKALLALWLAAAACPTAFAQPASDRQADRDGAIAIAVPYSGAPALEHKAPGGRSRVVIPVYNNIAAGPDAGYFGGTVSGNTVRAAMDFLSLERPTSSGTPIGTASRISTVLIALDNEVPDFSMTVTIDFYATLVDWRPSPGPVLDEPVGGVFFDITPSTPHDGPVYTVDLSAIGGISLPRGRCCVDVRTWVYNNGQYPITPSTTGRVLFRSGVTQPLPSVGYSPDNAYFDLDGTAGYQRTDRVSFGGRPSVANLGIALYTDEGCTIDFNGDGFVNGVDIDRLLGAIEAGCPY